MNTNTTDALTRVSAAKQLTKLQLPPLPEGLTKKQTRFLQAYAKTPDDYAALKSAGYFMESPDDAPKIMYNLRRNPDIPAYLELINHILTGIIEAGLTASAASGREATFYSDLPLHVLSNGQRRFVLAYTGDGLAALAEAGLAPTKQNLLRIMGLPAVRKCIDRVREYMDEGMLMKSQDILSRVEDIASDSSVPPATKLKALDMLAKYRGMSSEKLIIERVEKKAEIPYEPKPMILELDDDTELILKQ